jgi:hypothetical protein
MPANPSSSTKTSTPSKAVTDPKTGQSYAAPSYSAFSKQGLTSTDAANVARNREAAARYAASSAGRDGGGSGATRKAPSSPAAPAPETPEDRAARAARLAAIGASVKPSGPVEVATPGYGLASLAQGPDAQPLYSYGQAFAPRTDAQADYYYGQAAGMPQPQYMLPPVGPRSMDQLDIFGPPPDLSFMYR